MITKGAIWFPYWYELDQSIEVGAIDDFHFFTSPPEELMEEGYLVFHHGLWRPENSLTRRIRVRSIRNSHFGSVKKIDCHGLDYTLTLASGEQQKVEAEETPGLAYNWPEPITDWRFWVEFDFVEK